MGKINVFSAIFIPATAILIAGPALATNRIFAGGGWMFAKSNNVGILGGGQSNDTDTSTTPGGTNNLAYMAGLSFGVLPGISLRLGYLHNDGSGGKGDIALSGGGGGTSKVSYSIDSGFLDLMVRFAGVYAGVGALYGNSAIQVAYSLSNPAGTVQDDTLKASGTALGQRAFAGIELGLPPIHLFFEGGIQALTIAELKTTKEFNYSKNASNPNSGIANGDKVRKWVSESPNGFRGDSLTLDHTQPYLMAGLSLGF